MSRILKSQRVTVTPSHFVIENDDRVVEIPKDEISQEDTEEKIKNLVKDAENYCSTIINKAKEDKESIIQLALEESAAIRQEAYAEGYESGREEGYNAALTLVSSNIEEAISIKERAKEKYNELLVECEQDVVNFVMACVGEILNSEEVLQEQFILNLIAKGFEKLNYCSSATIRVSDTDYEIVNNSRRKILAMAERIDSIEIVIDPSISKGDCIIDTPLGNIDCSISTQYDKLKEVVKGILG